MVFGSAVVAIDPMSPSTVLMFVTLSLLHFAHDSVGIGWGLRWGLRGLKSHTSGSAAERILRMEDCEVDPKRATRCRREAQRSELAQKHLSAAVADLNN